PDVVTAANPSILASGANEMRAFVPSHSVVHLKCVGAFLVGQKSGLSEIREAASGNGRQAGQSRRGLDIAEAVLGEQVIFHEWRQRVGNAVIARAKLVDQGGAEDVGLAQ